MGAHEQAYHVCGSSYLGMLEAKRSTVIDVVLIGRSNVGKSTLINSLTRHKQLARVSKSPGRTRAIHLFSLELVPAKPKDSNPEKKRMVLADLPGLGYAKVSKVEKAKINKMLNDFFERSSEFKCVLHIFDARRVPNEEDFRICSSPSSN